MASTYKLADYDSDAERKKIPQRPPRENLLAAATFITLLLARNNIDYATMGGFAMICRGSTRNTTDVDIIVDTSFARLWDVLQKQPRLKVPDKKIMEGIIKVFVATGPSQDDPGCNEDHWVEVDLLEPGFKGAPKELAPHQVHLTFTVGQLQQTFLCLDTAYMVRSKIKLCVTRGLERDVHDVLYLLDHYGDEIAQHTDQLDKREIDHFLTLPWSLQVPPDTFATYRRILGVERLSLPGGSETSK